MGSVVGNKTQANLLPYPLSHTQQVGKKGYFVCSEAYFREYVYEVIVRKKHLTDAQRALLEQPPVRIQPWEGDWL